ncbi:hypothetical protein C7M84_006074 [Penaeus vannamei]|uniref:Uncharacterized protein n=1 Tax=Penaeus vannamei TaxID=6689 RepID=A0A3R7MG05_PENVA|nr:hypothetical protein C7M84_006074 [Penaeus vannamei]
MFDFGVMGQRHHNTNTRTDSSEPHNEPSPSTPFPRKFWTRIAYRMLLFVAHCLLVLFNLDETPTFLEGILAIIVTSEAIEKMIQILFTLLSHQPFLLLLTILSTFHSLSLSSTFAWVHSEFQYPPVVTDSSLGNTLSLRNSLYFIICGPFHALSPERGTYNRFPFPCITFLPLNPSRPSAFSPLTLSSDSEFIILRSGSHFLLVLCHYETKIVGVRSVALLCSCQDLLLLCLNYSLWCPFRSSFLGSRSTRTNQIPLSPKPSLASIRLLVVPFLLSFVEVCDETDVWLSQFERQQLRSYNLMRKMEGETSLENTLLRLNKMIESLPSLINRGLRRDDPATVQRPQTMASNFLNFHVKPGSLYDRFGAKSELLSQYIETQITGKSFVDHSPSAYSVQDPTKGLSDVVGKSFGILKQMALEVNFLHTNLYRSLTRQENSQRRQDLMLDEMARDVQKAKSDIQQVINVMLEMVGDEMRKNEKKRKSNLDN